MIEQTRSLSSIASLALLFTIDSVSNRALCFCCLLSLADRDYCLYSFTSLIPSTFGLVNKFSTAFEMPGKFGTLIGAIDEGKHAGVHCNIKYYKFLIILGTSSARFLIFKAETTEIVASFQKSVTNIFPREGWYEQSPTEILDVVVECIEKACKQLVEIGGNKLIISTRKVWTKHFL